MSKGELIESGKTALGIEFGSTRIKAVLIDLDGNVLGIGFHDWENSLVDGIWTYSLDEIHTGLRDCYSSLRKEVENTYGVTIKKTGAIGISAMMHGYVSLGSDGAFLVPFRTWRKTTTGEAAGALTTMFSFNIPAICLPVLQS